MEPNYRRCIVCRKVAHKSEFWRIVRLHPTHIVVLDQGMGRSAYLCPQESCLKVAQKKSRFQRSLKIPVPDSIYGELWQRLTNQRNLDHPCPVPLNTPTLNTLKC